MTRTSSSATPAATSGPTICPLRTGLQANWAVGSFRDLRTRFQDPGFAGTGAGRHPSRVAPPRFKHSAHSKTAVRAAAPDSVASARADPEGLGSRRAGGSSFDLRLGEARSHFSNLVRFGMSLDDDRDWAATIYQERAETIDADRNVTYFFLKDYQEITLSSCFVICWPH
jgi:hypothetical protein